MKPRTELERIAWRAMVDRGFLPGFSRSVQVELEAIAKRPLDGDGDSSVRDMTGLLWASIDNDDTRDIDQLTVSETLKGGVARILVAIADVDALVDKGCPIDLRAAHNTTTVYAGPTIFPMLPERLSTDLSSLVEGQDRLAIVVEVDVDPKGEVLRFDLCRAKVRNRAKLAYDGVAAWLDGKKPPPAAMARTSGIDQQIKEQDRIAQCLKAVRHAAGALDLQTIEARPVFDGERISAMKVETENRAKQLIEDFMIAANGATARYLEKKAVPSIRRVVRTPKRWDRIVAVAAEHGEKLPDQPNAAALEEFLQGQRARDPVRFPDLSLVIVKLLGAGEYVVEYPGKPPIGHFGLAVRDYTHSTAPNRRYPDVLTQRLVKAAIAGRPPPYAPGELDALARHCTLQEDEANKVERQVRKSAAALLLEPRVGEKFDGLVTGASAKGTWARIFDPPAEGRIIQGFERLDVGERVTLKLVSTDVERGFIDFARMGARRS